MIGTRRFAVHYEIGVDEFSKPIRVGGGGRASFHRANRGCAVDHFESRFTGGAALTVPAPEVSSSGLGRYALVRY